MGLPRGNSSLCALGSAAADVACSTRICDPEFNEEPARIDAIPSAAFADAVAQNITANRTHSFEYYHPEFDVHATHGTVRRSLPRWELCGLT
jgi:hypothetical protein